MIAIGQLYYADPINEYLIVTKSARGQINYAGKGFVGHSEDQSFIERFQPVDPTDVDSAELEFLLSHCPPSTRASTGFILQD